MNRPVPGPIRKPSSRRPPFLWGVATSAYQSEGGYNGDGQPVTNWAEAERKREVQATGRAADFLARYPEDFSLATALGLNAFRLGVEWSRIQPRPPTATDDGYDDRALELYAEMVAKAQRHGLEPIVTLHHFIHPGWLGSDPWLSAGSAELFRDYTVRTLQRLNRLLTARQGGSSIRYLLTINEPNMLVFNTYLGHQFPGCGHRGLHSSCTALATLLRAHVLAYNGIHDLYAREGWPAPQITLNTYSSDLYWTDKLILDLLSIRERQIHDHDGRDYICDRAAAFDRAFDAAHIPLHHDLPFFFGALLKRLSNRLGYKHFQTAVFQPVLDAIRQAPRDRNFDFLALDYYDPFVAHMFRFPVFWDHEFRNRSLRSWVLNTVTSKWWDWRVLPRGLHFFCDFYSRDFDGREVMIAENGMALRRRPDNRVSPRRDRMRRSDFLRLHVHEVTRIVNSGVPLIGYLHWSLFDNYEWGSFTPRFGLFSLDYTKGTERLIEDHLGDRPAETYARLIEEARQKMTPVER